MGGLSMLMIADNMFEDGVRGFLERPKMAGIIHQEKDILDQLKM